MNERHPMAEALERKGGTGDCPSCGDRGNGGWLYPPGDGTATFTLDTMDTIDIQPMVCLNCGFVRLHAKAFLEEQDASRR